MVALPGDQAALRHVPWPRIELVTFWFVGHWSNQLSHTSQGHTSLISNIMGYPQCFMFFIFISKIFSTYFVPGSTRPWGFSSQLNRQFLMYLTNFICCLMVFSDTVSYTHLTLPTRRDSCRSRWSPYH